MPPARLDEQRVGCRGSARRAACKRGAADHRTHRPLSADLRRDHLGDAPTEPLVGGRATDVDELGDDHRLGRDALRADADRRQPAEQTGRRGAGRMEGHHGSIDAGRRAAVSLRDAADAASTRVIAGVLARLRQGQSQSRRRQEEARTDRHGRGLCSSIWIKLPHESSNIAVMTGPRSFGGCTNRTPFATRRSCSASMSSTAKAV